MIKVTVKQMNFDTMSQEAVAEVTYNGNGGINAALEYAYFRTQNIDGSWSRGESITRGAEAFVNGDYSADVKLLVKLPVSKNTGQEMGLRSSGMFDVFVVYDTDYVCSAVGFEAYEQIELAQWSEYELQQFDYGYSMAQEAA